MIELKTRMRKNQKTSENSMIQIAIYRGKNNVRFEAHIYPRDEILTIRIIVLSDEIPRDADVANFLFELQKELISSEESIVDVSKIQTCNVLYQYCEIEFNNLPYDSSEDFLKEISGSKQ